LFFPCILIDEGEENLQVMGLEWREFD